MKIITPGHRYELASFKPVGSGEPQVIQFVENVPGEPPLGSMVRKADGTTNEEVLAVLIDRLKFLNEKMPSRFNSLALTKMEEARMWLNERTRDREARGVEGTPNA